MKLPYAVVDPHSPVPLYHQIYLDMRQMIQQEVIPPGGMLPPELEICQAYNVGRQTIRQAIARLVDDNLVERFAGKGTFVRSVQSLRQFFLDRSFSQQMKEMGKIPQSRILNLERSLVSTDKVPALRNWKGAECMILERLRLGDHEPICHQTSTVLTQNCPGIMQEDFTRASLYEVLASKYHLLINRIDHIVRAVAADEYRAELLNVNKDSPLLFVGTTAYYNEAELIEYSAAYYRADRFSYSTSHSCCAE